MASAAQAFAELHKLSPAEAVAYMQKRSKVSPSYAWQDLWQDEHAQQFTVSRLARLDLLQDIREQIAKSVQGDLSRRDFLRNAEQLLAKAGWWGEKVVVDPATKKELLTRFDPPRLKLIFDTNTRMAYAAGQWERFERNVKTHPYLRYITKRDERVRAAHRAWDRVTLPVGHPFWLTHFPPNGWRCRCRVVAVSQREYDRSETPTGAPMVKQAPEVQMREWIDSRTGEIRTVPVGIDPGFGYNVGVASARWTALESVVAQRLAKASPDLAQAARNEGMATWHTPMQATAAVKFVERSVKAPRVKQPLQVLGSVSSLATDRAKALGVNLAGRTVALEHDGVLHTLKSHGQASEALRGQIPVTVEDLARFRDLFNRAKLVLGDPPVAKDGSKVLVGEVVLGGVVYHLAVRVRRKHVVPFTMFKRAVRK